MAFRPGNEGEYEGWWEPVAGSQSPKVRGKIEWEPSTDGGTEIDLLVKKLDIADGHEVEVVCDGDVVLRAVVESGQVRKIIKSAEGHTIPDLGGKAVELRYGQTVIARTVLEPD